MAYLKINISKLQPGTFFQFDNNEEAIVCQMISSIDGTFTFNSFGKSTVTEFSQTEDSVVYLINKVPVLLTDPKKSMNTAQLSVVKKMDYIVDKIAKGPLSCIEEEQLIELLKTASKHNSIWGNGIKIHFATMENDEGLSIWPLVESLAGQCMDDIFTMVCVLGQDAVIYILRTVDTKS